MCGFCKLFKGSKRKRVFKFLKFINENSTQKENETYDDFIERMFTIQDKLDEYYDYATTLKGFPNYTEDFFGKIMPKILVLDIIQTLVLTYLCNNKCIMKNEQNNNEPTKAGFYKKLDC